MNVESCANDMYNCTCMWIELGARSVAPAPCLESAKMGEVAKVRVLLPVHSVILRFFQLHVSCLSAAED